MDAPFVLTRAQSRLVDLIAIDECGIPGIVLMENAGRGTVEVLLEFDPALAQHQVITPAPSPSVERAGEREQPSTGDQKSPERRAVVQGNPGTRSTTSPPTPLHQGEGSGGMVTILAGKGNNAGDGFVIARHLEIRGVATRVLLLCPPSELTGDALVNYEILARSGADVVDLSSPPAVGVPSLSKSLDRYATGAAWLIDAMLGTGAVGEPREPVRTAIEWMNAQPARRLAVDIPSGLDCDTGAAASATVRADVTCTFVAAKPGFLLESAAQFVGQLHVISIGVPRFVVEQAAQS